MNSDRIHQKIPTKIEEESVNSVYKIMQLKFEAALWVGRMDSDKLWLLNKECKENIWIKVRHVEIH